MHRQRCRKIRCMSVHGDLWYQGTFAVFPEIQILDTGKLGTITIGLVPMGYPLHLQPGCGEQSIGYHADDGRLYNASGWGETFSMACGKGDRMGCGIKFHQIELRYKNQVPVGTVMCEMPIGGFFPATGQHSVGERVQLDMNVTFGNDGGMGVINASIERMSFDGDTLSYLANKSGDVGTYIAGEQITPEQNYFEKVNPTAGLTNMLDVHPMKLSNQIVNYRSHKLF
ncbi:SPRY domain-containing protein 3-like [Saccoglossus kowalevskii]